MQLFIFLIVAISFPSLSFGRKIKCRSCDQVSDFPRDYCRVYNGGIHIFEKECENRCLFDEYMENSTMKSVDCDLDSDPNYFPVFVHYRSTEAYCDILTHHDYGSFSDYVNRIPNETRYFKRCSCGTSNCNKFGLQCFSCFGNRAYNNGSNSHLLNPVWKNEITDYVCKDGEVPKAINCSLDAQECAISWDEQHTTIGCYKSNNRYDDRSRIPHGLTSYCDGNSDTGFGQCNCNTDLCNINDLRKLLPKPTTTTKRTTTKKTYYYDVDKSGENTGKSYESISLFSIIIIVVIVIIVIIVGVVLFYFFKKNRRNYPPPF